MIHKPTYQELEQKIRQLETDNQFLENQISVLQNNYSDKDKRLKQAKADANELKYKSLFNALQEGVYLHEVIYDKAGNAIDYKIIDANAISEKYLQIKREEAIGKTATQLYQTTTAPFIEIYAKVAETGEPYAFEEYFAPMDKYFLISVFSPQKGQFATAFLDITERKKIEKEIIVAKEQAEANEQKIKIQNEKIHHNNERLESLLKVSQYQTNSIQELLDFALDEAIKLTNSKIGYIYYYNSQKEQFILNSWSKNVMQECAITDPQTVYDLDKTGIWGEAVRQRKPIMINNFQAENPLKKGYPKGHVKLLRYLTIPVFSGNEIVAVAAVANKEADYDTTDIRQLTLLLDNVWNISERLRLIDNLQTAKDQAEESDANIKAIIEGTTDSIWAFNLNYEILYINRTFQNEFYQSFGIKLDVGSNLINALPAVLQPVWKQRYDRALANEQFTVEDEVETLMGTVYIQVSFNPILKNGKVIGGSCFGSDITFRKTAEIKLLKAKEEAEYHQTKYIQLFNQVADAIFIYDPISFEIIEANKATAEIYGYSRRELIGLSCLRFSEEVEKSQSVNTIAREKGSEGVNLRHHKRKDGTDIFVQLFVSQIAVQGKKLMFAVSKDITERIKAEQALKESENRFRAIFEQAGVGVALLNTKTGQYVKINNKYCDFMGYSEHEMLHKSFAEITHPEDIQLNIDANKKLIKEELEVFTYSKRYIHKNGNILWGRLTISPLWKTGEKPEVYLHIAIVEDITEQKQAEQALKESEEKFRTLIAKMRVGVLLQGPKAEMLLSNQAALELLGLSWNQLIGKSSFDPFWNVIHEDGSPFPGETHPVPKAIATGKQVRGVVMGVYRPEKKDRVWLLVDAIPQFNQHGAIQQVICTFIDITDRKNAEQALRENETRLKKAESIGKLGYYEINPQVHKAFWSDEIYTIYELDKKTFIPDHNNYLEYIHPDDKEKVLANFNAELRYFADFSLDYRIVTDTNHIKWIHATATVEKNEQHIPVKIFGTVQDITKIKLLSEEINSKNAALEKHITAQNQFISILGHDLKNPFHSLLGFSELLINNMDKYDKEKIEIQLKIIHQIVNRTYHLLTDLLLWSKAQSNSIPFEPEIFSFNEVCTEILELQREIAKEKHIVISLLNDINIELKADKNMFKTIIRNLISNAIKFTHPNGYINISAAKTPNGIAITVSDNGVGIEKERMAKLWQFSKNYSTRGTIGEQGTGFGLILCKEFVEKHQGKIWVESELGKGSEFKITLPQTLI